MPLVRCFVAKKTIAGLTEELAMLTEQFDLYKSQSITLVEDPTALLGVKDGLIAKLEEEVQAGIDYGAGRQMIIAELEERIIWLTQTNSDYREESERLSKLVQSLQSEVWKYEQAVKVNVVGEIWELTAGEREVWDRQTTDIESGMPVELQGDKAEFFYRTRIQPKHDIWNHVKITQSNDTFSISWDREYQSVNVEACYSFLGRLIEYLRKNAQSLKCDALFVRGGARVKIRPRD